MAGQMLLINPAKRAKRKGSAKRRKAPSAAQRANWARFARMARSRAGSRSANPASRRRARSAGPVRRRRNPVSYVRRAVSRRRRNPIKLGGSLFNFRSYLAPLKDAAVMGAGAVAMDVGFSYVNRYLPASMQKVPGTVGVADALKAVLTVALGRLLAKPTRGLSNKAAMGSLVVQFRDITMQLLPPGSLPGLNGLGFVTPAYTVPQIRRASSYTRPGNTTGISMITQGQRSPILGMITQGQRSPLLGARVAARPGRR